MLLSHCVTSELQPLDTTKIRDVAHLAMRYNLRPLIDFLTTQNPNPHLPSMFASYSCASFLLVLASSCAVSTAPESPTSAAAQSFTLILIRIALIYFACSRKTLPAATELIYNRIFNLIAISIESFYPNLMIDDQPLLQRLATDDSETCGELIQIYKQHVVNDEATISACSTIVNAALKAARNAAEG